MNKEVGQGKRRTRRKDLLHDVEDGRQDCSTARGWHGMEGQVVSGDKKM